MTDFMKSHKSIQAMLTAETLHNRTEPWNKLDKTTKLKLLSAFVDTLLTKQYCLTLGEIAATKIFFEQLLDDKKLLYVKEVRYDKLACQITGIPQLHFNPARRAFELVRATQPVSMLNSLGLGRESHK
jgi:hypothetical protein